MLKQGPPMIKGVLSEGQTAGFEKG